MPAPVLHGRDAPLTALRDALASAHEGRGQLLLLTGEAGIGKSALAEVIAAEAQASRAAVTWGRAWEFAEAPPYFPLWPCMRSLGIDAVAGELDESRAFELWERVLSALAHEARSRTIVWLVEDLHAADLGTLDLLTYLVQPLRALRVLVVATLRPHDPRLGERKLQRLARMSRDGREIGLERLEPSAIAAVAEDTLGRALPEDARQRLAELTGGNPLFVVECARAFRTGGERILEQLAPTVRHVVLERIAMLPEATRRLLEAGAVLGRELVTATLARMIGSQPARVIDELLPALRAGVLHEARPGTFVFSHVLVRDAIEDALGADARARLHAAAEPALADLGDSAEILVERARHALSASGVADPDHVLGLVRRASQLLEREGAFDHALALHVKAGAARAAGFLAAATAEDKLHVARIARDAARLDLMQQLCDEVIAVARASEDGELFARAVLLHATVVRAGVIDARQVALLEEARALLAPSSPGSCRVLARLATALQPADDVTIPNDHARTALRDAHALGDDATILDVLHLGALGNWGAPRAERIAWCEELRERALRAGEIPKAIDATSYLGLWRMEGGDLDGFADACAQALALADGAPHPRYRWDPLLLASSYACARGHFAESERYVTEVAQIAALVDDPALAVAHVHHEANRAKLRRRADELAAVLPRLDRTAAELKRGALVIAAFHASCSARFGDVAATRSALASLGTQVRVLEADESIAYLAEACALAGEDADRRRIRDVLERVPYTDIYAAGVGYAYEGTVERLIGLLDASLGNLDAAEARLRRAHAHATRHGLRPWIAQVAHELAQVLARRGRDARELIEEAAAIGRDLGMQGFAAASPLGASPSLHISRTADVWTIERGTAVARVKDSRGMHLLARLLERPGEEIHVLALASDEGAAAPDSHAGELLDERARRAYRKRLAELDDAIVRAEQRGDAKASARHEAEKSALVRELARATGLGGSARMAGSSTQRARVNVQRRVKEALQRITEADAGLGAYLETAVRTGTYCCFRP